MRLFRAGQGLGGIYLLVVVVRRLQVGVLKPTTSAIAALLLYWLERIVSVILKHVELVAPFQ
jgi:hypothetical protein